MSRFRHRAAPRVLQTTTVAGVPIRDAGKATIQDLMEAQVPAQGRGPMVVAVQVGLEYLPNLAVFDIAKGGDGGDSEDLTVLVGVGVSVAFGTCFALFVISLLVILVMKRWRQREAQKDLMQYERQRRRKSGQLSAPVNDACEESSLSTTPDREAYSSLAPLIRNWNIEQGNTDYETLKRVEEATKD